MSDFKRTGLATLIGAALGIICIVGVGSRVGYSGNELFLFAMWYNRIVMGLLIGVAGNLVLLEGEERKMHNAGIRGALLGLFVSSAIFFSTNFRDVPAFFAGIVYGLLIDLIVTKLVNGSS